MSDLYENGLTSALLSAYYMPRPRIDSILDTAVQCKLVYVVAGAGYGKTQAVRQYIEQQTDAIVRWIQLSESDNIGSRYWENFTHVVSSDNPELARKLRELGFPETQSRFKQFAEILENSEHRAVKAFLVLDDFHLIKSDQALAFAERCAYLQIPGACVIIISRTEPNINAVSLFAKGQVSIITEDELRFQDEEVSHFLKQRGILFPAKNLPQLVEATQGWGIALQLLSLVLKKTPNNLEFALETMKQNIYKLMEIEAFNEFPENHQKTLIKLSLVSDIPLTILKNLYNDTSFIFETTQLASFIWFDSFTGEHRVHPQYWEFLKSKQDILSDEEIFETYQLAAQWCSTNDFRLDAMYYFSKLRDYKSMVSHLFSFPFKLPFDTCEYFLKIIEDLDESPGNEDDDSFLILKNYFIPLLLIGMGRYDEAKEKTLNSIEKWENVQTHTAYRLLYASYSNMAYIDIYTCTVTHVYDSPEYMKKSREYFNLYPHPPTETSASYTVADIRSFACLVGEGADYTEFDKFLEAVDMTAFYIAETHHSMYYGYEDLVNCELAFFRNQPDLAKKHAYQAITKAREKKQYGIEMMAAQYLLRISMQEGDYQLSNEIQKQLRTHLDNFDFWNRQLLYDSYIGFFYALIGLPKMVPTWLIMDEAEATATVQIPTLQLLACVKTHLASKKYEQALTVLTSSYPRKPQERFVLSELILTLMSALARIKTGNTADAMNDFEKAYLLSYNGIFEMPFVEMGKDLRPLIAAAAKEDSVSIPDEWLKSVSRKANVYAKKIAVITNSIKSELRIKDTISLSEREEEVLIDLYHGLSREEIAENRYLSVNTVKKTLQSIYMKLDANNNVDAVRIAIEMKLIE